MTLNTPNLAATIATAISSGMLGIGGTATFILCELATFRAHVLPAGQRCCQSSEGSRSAFRSSASCWPPSVSWGLYPGDSQLPSR